MILHREEFVEPLTDASDMDKLARQRRERQSRRATAAPSAKDIEQDAQIRALQAENKELKIYLAQLVRTLVDRNVVSQDDVSHLIASVAEVEQKMGLELVAHRVDPSGARTA